jgi:CO/xanthine dehydrogenase FAD-binding subunit
VAAEAIARSLHGTQLEDATIDAAVESIGQCLEPGSDVHATAEYRIHLARVLAARVLRQARTNATGLARDTRA